ncbi:MAG: glycosyltransferase [Candidatus Cloacimonas sp.]|jgi:glycosyltransferase involved in cell wall biosynthesis|nr:glycosyltransferase [Candidatus Cloacimonas sp.]
MIKVLLIPSWHPCPKQQYAGKFFIEQAEALAEKGLAEISILDWGQNEFQLTVRKPLQSLGKFVHYLAAKPTITVIGKNLTRIRIPHLSWTSLLLSGNIDALLSKINLSDKPDIIHAHVTFPAGYIAWKLSEKLGIPFIITEHSGPFPFPEYVTRKGISPLLSEPLRAASRVLAVSSHLSQQIQACIGIDAKVIPNMVNTDFFQFQQKPERIDGLYGKDHLKLFALSALSTAKGAWELVQSMKQLKDSGQDFHLYWGGDGSLRSKLHKRITDLHLQHNVLFLGQLSPEQTLRQYQNCEIFVMPSRIESFSMVLIEAMACGKPVVATNCGGPADIVRDFCGRLVPVQNPQAFASAISEIAKNLGSYKPAEIRDYCVTQFGQDLVCQEITTIYAECLR